MQKILDERPVVNRSDNRIQLESEKYQASVRLTWNNETKIWLLTFFDKKESISNNTTDTVKTTKGNENDTATPENTIPIHKGINLQQEKAEYIMANWISEGLLEYVDKKRMPEWLSKQRSNSADVRHLFKHVTNIVNNFENQNIDSNKNSYNDGGLINDNKNTSTSNPISSDEIKKIADSLASELGVKVKYVQSSDKSKAAGGKYFLDKNLLSFVENGGFFQRGNEMVAKVDDNNMSSLLNYLWDTHKLKVLEFNL